MFKNKVWSNLEIESPKFQIWDRQSSFLPLTSGRWRKRNDVLPANYSGGNSAWRTQEPLKTQGRTRRKPLNTEENEAPVLSPKLLTKPRRPGRLPLRAQKWPEIFYSQAKEKGSFWWKKSQRQKQFNPRSGNWPQLPQANRPNDFCNKRYLSSTNSTGRLQ